MKASELRIGNYIKPIGDFPYWEVSSKDIEHIDRFPEEYEPIPLTERWLLDFDIVHNETEGKRFLIKFSFYIEYDPEDGLYDIFESVNDSYVMSVEYVHELQNAYFMLEGNGEELTIKEKV